MAATQDETNFARVSIMILDVSTGVLRDILKSEISPQNLATTVANWDQRFRKKINLNSHQENLIQLASSSNSYEEFDMTLCYLLIRNVCPHLKPTAKWGAPPAVQDVSVGDDLERLRLFRNKVFGHTSSASIPINEYNTFVNDMLVVMPRFDAYKTTR